jgi:hypothetical protein
VPVKALLRCYSIPALLRLRAVAGGAVSAAEARQQARALRRVAAASSTSSSSSSSTAAASGRPAHSWTQADHFGDGYWGVEHRGMGGGVTLWGGGPALSKSRSEPLPPPSRCKSGGVRVPGTNFTCFTSTKVQILTPEELASLAGAADERNECCVCMDAIACTRLGKNDGASLISGTKVLKYIFFRVIRSLISGTKVLQLVVLKYIFLRVTQLHALHRVFFSFFGQLMYLFFERYPAPCAHDCLCNACALIIVNSGGSCPLCRTATTGFIKISARR